MERFDCESTLNSSDLPAVRKLALIVSITAWVAAAGGAALFAATAAAAVAAALFDGNEAATGGGVPTAASCSIAVPNVWANQGLTGS